MASAEVVAELRSLLSESLQKYPAARALARALAMLDGQLDGDTLGDAATLVTEALGSGHPVYRKFIAAVEKSRRGSVVQQVQVDGADDELGMSLWVPSYEPMEEEAPRFPVRGIPKIEPPRVAPPPAEDVAVVEVVVEAGDEVVDDTYGTYVTYDTFGADVTEAVAEPRPPLAEAVLLPPLVIPQLKPAPPVPVPVRQFHAAEEEPDVRSPSVATSLDLNPYEGTPVMVTGSAPHEPSSAMFATDPVMDVTVDALDFPFGEVGDVEASYGEVEGVEASSDAVRSASPGEGFVAEAEAAEGISQGSWQDDVMAPAPVVPEAVSGEVVDDAASESDLSGLEDYFAADPPLGDEGLGPEAERQAMEVLRNMPPLEDVSAPAEERWKRRLQDVSTLLSGLIE